MLKEPESSPEYQPKPQIPPTVEDRPQDAESPYDYHKLRELIRPHFAIAFEENAKVEKLSPEDKAYVNATYNRLIVSYTGYLKSDSEKVYKELDASLESENLFPLFRTNSKDSDAAHIIHIIEGRPLKRISRTVLPNILLFIFTIISVLYTGSIIAIHEIGLDDPSRAEAMKNSIWTVLPEIWRGWSYALAIMLVLVAHEMGHYVMIRRHGAQASLPYFIPGWLVSPFGTYGAMMIMDEPLKNRKALLDVGATGPLLGFIVAVPLIFIGLSTSNLIPLTQGDYVVEGNSIIYLLAKFMTFGEILPNGEFDVLVNQVAWAGWTGLLLTAFNLIPVGMLDGGQVLYALFGARARHLYYPVLIGLVTLSIMFVQLTWIIILILLYFFGRFYHLPHDDITTLNPTRRWIGLACIVVFIISFPPVPLYINQAGAENLNTAFHFGTIFIAALIALPRWRKLYQLR